MWWMRPRRSPSHEAYGVGGLAGGAVLLRWAEVVGPLNGGGGGPGPVGVEEARKKVVARGLMRPDPLEPHAVGEAHLGRCEAVFRAPAHPLAAEIADVPRPR